MYVIVDLRSALYRMKISRISEETEGRGEGGKRERER